MTQVPTSNEERLGALENQTYIMYLQLNAAIKMLIDKEVIDKDALVKEMDELNAHLYQITEQLVQEGEQPAPE